MNNFQLEAELFQGDGGKLDRLSKPKVVLKNYVNTRNKLKSYRVNILGMQAELLCGSSRSNKICG
jgi:hypothetical protein